MGVESNFSVFGSNLKTMTLLRPRPILNNTKSDLFCFSNKTNPVCFLGICYSNKASIYAFILYVCIFLDETGNFVFSAA